MGFERIWHKSYAAGVPPAIELERITMAEVLRRTAGRFPDRIAFHYLGRKITFRELESLVNRFTRALAALGVRAGDKVATLLPNLPQHVIANHACYRLGAVTVMNNPLYTERELEAQLNDSDARFLITLDLLLPRALKIKAATKIETIIPCHINDYLPFPTRQLIPYLKKELHRKVVPGPGFLPGVPTIFMGLLNREAFRKMDLSFIKRFFTGAAPLAPDTAKQLQALTGKGIYDVYGLTEDTAFATCTPWKGKAKQGTVGVPLPNTDLKIVDLETGLRELPAGEAGEICIKGPQLMTGYYKKPEETANALRDGWLYTGDIGFLDEEGRLSVVDRKKDMIIAGGYNVYPKEIDEVLFDHPKILEACAVGVPDEYRGETIKAFVVVKPGESLTDAEIIEYCRERLAAYKAPKRIAFLDALPKSAAGKILRRELQVLEAQKEG